MSDDLTQVAEVMMTIVNGPFVVGLFLLYSIENLHETIIIKHVMNV